MVSLLCVRQSPWCFTWILTPIPHNPLEVSPTIIACRFTDENSRGPKGTEWKVKEESTINMLDIILMPMVSLQIFTKILWGSCHHKWGNWGRRVHTASSIPALCWDEATESLIVLSFHKYTPFCKTLIKWSKQSACGSLQLSKVKSKWLHGANQPSTTNSTHHTSSCGVQIQYLVSVDNSSAPYGIYWGHSVVSSWLDKLVWRVQDGFLHTWHLGGDNWKAGFSWVSLSLPMSSQGLFIWSL